MVDLNGGIGYALFGRQQFGRNLPENTHDNPFSDQWPFKPIFPVRSVDKPAPWHK